MAAVERMTHKQAAAAAAGEGVPLYWPGEDLTRRRDKWYRVVRED